jgi:V/A-type H+-transporting ATPase subunit C
VAGGVSAYAALSARVRVKYSELLSPFEFGALREAPDLPALVEHLKKTPYGTAISEIKERETTAGAVVAALKRRLGEVCSSVLQASPGGARAVLAQLCRRYEVGNLKAVLRGIVIAAGEEVGASRWDRIHPLLFPSQVPSGIPTRAMLEAGSIPAAVDLLRGLHYYEVLSHALKRYTAEQSLFPLEVALDLDYWRQLWHRAQGLAGEDQLQAVRIIGALVDTSNVMWVIRYRVYQGLSEEELINYSLPFGYRVRDEDIRALAAGGDIASLLSRLYPSIADPSSLIEDPLAGLPLLEVQLKRDVERRCTAAFLGSPFHVGLALALLVLQDLEIQDLILLTEAKSTQLAPDMFQQYLTRGLPVAA